ncbi:MAG: lysophospholipid acyltransferase family protein [Planctomycetes bacterium]|nr:lysophospholipid acyltransferase family protein [Planctomycetota bacterium]
MDAQGSSFLPAAPNPRVARAFAWYTRRLFSKRFFAVRLTPGSRGLLSGLRDHPGPAIVLMSHASWWDPMTAVLLNCEFTEDRPTAAPMDIAMLRRFAFFRKLGVFGINPDDPASLEAMGRYMLDRFAADTRTNLWVTAQGEFHDPRTPARLRPGAAWLAARTPGVRVLCCAIEYAFWTDQRPETFICVQPVLPAERTGALSTADWLRATQAAMTACAATLADAVISRDPNRFDTLLGGDGARVNPLFDLWQRLRGRGNAIEVRSRQAGPTTTEPTSTEPTLTEQTRSAGA